MDRFEPDAHFRSNTRKRARTHTHTHSQQNCRTRTQSHKCCAMCVVHIWIPFDFASHLCMLAHSNDDDDVVAVVVRRVLLLCEKICWIINFPLFSSHQNT